MGSCCWWSDYQGYILGIIISLYCILDNGPESMKAPNKMMSYWEPLERGAAHPVLSLHGVMVAQQQGWKPVFSGAHVVCHIQV